MCGDRCVPAGSGASIPSIPPGLVWFPLGMLLGENSGMRCSWLQLSPLFPSCPAGSGRMENKAMYLHTFSERENGSIFEEPFEGRSLSKLNLCEDGECCMLHLGAGTHPERGALLPLQFFGRSALGIPLHIAPCVSSAVLSVPSGLMGG